jgi:hypothetical protein
MTDVDMTQPVPGRAGRHRHGLSGMAASAVFAPGPVRETLPAFGSPPAGQGMAGSGRGRLAAPTNPAGDGRRIILLDPALEGTVE